MLGAPVLCNIDQEQISSDWRELSASTLCLDGQGEESMRCFYAFPAFMIMPSLDHETAELMN